jgi:hypothetical protein
MRLVLGASPRIATSSCTCSPRARRVAGGGGNLVAGSQKLQTLLVKFACEDLSVMSIKAKELYCWGKNH